jgi:hypothetical protein
MIKNKKAFWIAFFYVGIASLVLFTMYPKDILYNEKFNDLNFLLLLLTFPANVISFGIRYGSSETYIPVIVTQLVFFSLWYKFLESRIK